MFKSFQTHFPVSAFRVSTMELVGITLFGTILITTVFVERVQRDSIVKLVSVHCKTIEMGIVTWACCSFLTHWRITKINLISLPVPHLTLARYLSWRRTVQLFLRFVWALPSRILQGHRRYIGTLSALSTTLNHQLDRSHQRRRL